MVLMRLPTEQLKKSIEDYIMQSKEVSTKDLFKVVRNIDRTLRSSMLIRITSEAVRDIIKSGRIKVENDKIVVIQN